MERHVSEDAPIPGKRATRLLPAQRKLQLASLVADADVLTLDALAHQLGVSTQTIRRDLAHLERQGLVRRTHGGAITREALERSEPAFIAREATRAAEKRAIAQTALASLRRGETIFFDASTTVLTLVRLLPDDWQGTIIVTSLPAALEVSRLPGVHLTVVGGEFRFSSRSFGGPLAEEMLQRLCVDTAYISARGLDLGRGLMEAHAGEAVLKRIIMSNAERTIALVDSSKLGATATHRIAPLNAVHTLITDGQAPAGMVAEMRRHGIEVLVAGESGHPPA
jgi:DeoR/GlpR family transcriptional regulator of sugar metabolism